ncbi:type 1 fimbrial protein [Providencia heimbachae]|uniref:Fimbrial-type adhesion domain-containing protein n=2 Tax=Providencia heimbachae TaxID=333962 RepID=A0A1B7JRB2_9GAMM|nr:MULTISPECIES: fimbrial protein [Providencia]MBP6123983.1 type 1 fimbrial protein [Providencia sp.]NIH21200.1 type 1 fimbrial protein [Providencia heimbachae]OAT50447.1 hypothetical protein M998_2609 [Providencia heimbachae ATCC 35613]QCJ68804.1 type 1 fimbrial protein [Providencia heimbachae]SQH11835.1 PAP fimbrial minor pilin protein precursor [Providencia heimbachae]
MIVYQQLGRQIMLFIVAYVFLYPAAYSAKEMSLRDINAMAFMTGNVIATPCSIVMQNRYQSIDFSSLALTMLSTKTQREQHNQPFIIELRDCGSIYSSMDHKTWVIRFAGQSAEHINGFALQGASRGLGVSVLDNALNVLIPNQYYSLSDNVLRQDKSGNTLLLRYFLRLELTGQPIQAGNYQGLIRFYIDYQ